MCEASPCLCFSDSCHDIITRSTLMVALFTFWSCTVCRLSCWSCGPRTTSCLMISGRTRLVSLFLLLKSCRPFLLFFDSALDSPPSTRMVLDCGEPPCALLFVLPLQFCNLMCWNLVVKREIVKCCFLFYWFYTDFTVVAVEIMSCSCTMANDAFYQLHSHHSPSRVSQAECRNLSPWSRLVFPHTFICQSIHSFARIQLMKIIITLHQHD